MAVTLTRISNSQTFGTWLQRTNDLVDAISGNVVTTDASPGGAVTTGNAYVNGFLGAVTVWAGGALGNTGANSTAIYTSWGFAANASGLSSNVLIANAFTIASGIVSGNASGFYTNVVTCNVLSVSTTFKANSSAVNVATLTASANLIGNNAQLTSNLNVGSVTLSTSTLTIGDAILSSANLVLGGVGSVQSQNVFIANTSGNISIRPTVINTSWGISGNTSGFYANNLYVNTTITGNSSGLFTSNISSNSVLNVGSSSVNSTTVYAPNVVAINIYANAITTNNITTNNLILNNAPIMSGIILGNSSVNCAINSTVFFMGNSSYYDLYANTTGVYTNGNMTVTGNLYVTGNTISSGMIIGTGDYIPSSNIYNFGNTTNRWTIWLMSANVVGNISLTTNTSTISIGNSVVNATVNSTIYSGTSNNTSYVGVVTAANVVSNAQLSANLGNYTNTLNLTTTLSSYPTSTQLTNNLANYQTSSGVTANVYAVLPNYTNVLNASSLSVLTSILLGNSIVNTTANSTALKWSNSTVVFSLSAPTSVQVTNGQYYYDSAGAWTTLPTQYGNVLTTGTSTQNIDSWLMNSFYGAEYLIDVGDNVANNRTFTKILLTHDSNNSFVTEYATIITNSSMGVFEFTSNVTHVTLNFTPVSVNTTVRFAKTIL